MVDRIGLGDVRVVDLMRAHVFFKARNRIVGIDVDRIIHLHLQDEVRSAAQIEAKIDVIVHQRQWTTPRPRPRGPENARHEHQQDAQDED